MRLFTWAGMPIIVVACSVGQPAGTAVTPPSPLPTPTEPAITYTADWAGMLAFFDDACVTCHHETGPAATVPLPHAVQLDLLDGAGQYVVPNDAPSSALWRVVSDTMLDTDFGLMPEGTIPLPPETVAHVEAWILAGAPFDASDVDADGDGFSPADGDCDDDDASRSPGLAEFCDDIDNDCNGAVDDNASDASTWYADADLDGYGDVGQAIDACTEPSGYTALNGDCDDTDPAYNPGAVETCLDLEDFNCDNATGMVDTDADGWAACLECNDADPAINPDATEICDGSDNDCEGTIDQGAADATAWFDDVDGDGFGRLGAPTFACAQPSGQVANASDCDDTDAMISPAAPLDPADGIDNDCDGVIDEDAGVVSHVVDIQPIWDANCTTGCHGSGNPAAGLSLRPDAYGDLVGVPSGQAPIDLVAPGSAPSSYLWRKLEGTQVAAGGSGTKMPKNGSLSPAELSLIEQWILLGAAP